MLGICFSVFSFMMRSAFACNVEHINCLNVGQKHNHFIYLTARGNSQHKKEFDRHCDLVTHAAHACDNWEKIMANLTHPMIKTIDASCFSVEYFYKAVTFNWCVEYDNKISRRSGKKCDEILYTQADIDNIFQHIVSTGSLDGADASQASIGQQLERRCVNYALRHNPLE